jgi:hypothetical protein
MAERACQENFKFDDQFELVTRLRWQVSRSFTLGNAKAGVEKGRG